MAFKFSRGVFVKDIITGFSGFITARSDYLTGCNRYGIQPTNLDKDGKIQDWQWLDESLLEIDDSKQQIRLDRKIADQPPG